jgi:hypothetical protein
VAERLSQLMANKGHLDTQAEILADKALPPMGWLIHGCRRTAFHEFLQLLEAVKTRAGNTQIQADWANRSYATTISAQLTPDPETVFRLGLTTDPTDGAERSEQVEMARALYNTNLAFAATKAWSKGTISELSPRMWFGICDSDPELAVEASKRMRGECERLKKAIRISADRGPEADVPSILLFSTFMFVFGFSLGQPRVMGLTPTPPPCIALAYARIASAS